MLSKALHDDFSEVGGSRCVSVNAYTIYRDCDIRSIFRFDPAFSYCADDSCCHRLWIKRMLYASGKDDGPIPVVFAVGVELRCHRLFHLLRQFIRDGCPHTVQDEPGIHTLDCLDDRPRKRFVSCCHHVERPMWFYMLDTHAIIACELS